MENDLSFLYLKKKVSAKGANCAGYKDDFLKRRFEGRMRIKGLASFAEYAHYLDKNPTELNDLLDALTINVSEFFRDPTVWRSFRQKFLPTMIREKLTSGKKEFRIWSAGCADGEEPYTIALILLDGLSYLSKSFKVEIVGTDVDMASLGRARNGVYSPARLKLIDHSTMQKYFRPLENGSYEICNSVKTLVNFAPHDLFLPPPSSGLDLISCRNVIIYFTRDQQRTLFRSLCSALTPGGYLILGKVESILGEASELFGCVDLAERIYRKKPEPTFSQISTTT